MENILIGRRGATNVVATMLIFGIMIASVGVLYAQIAPTLLGYETRAAETNQEFIFQSVANEAIDLASSTEGSVSRVHIVSPQTAFDVSPDNRLNVTVFDGTTAAAQSSVDIAAFQSTVNGSFQPSGGEDYVNRVANEDTFLNYDSGEADYVLTSDFHYGEGVFTMYFRANVDVREVVPGSWKISVRIIQIDFQQINGDPTVFPLKIDEWTLRLRRQATPDPVTASIAGLTNPMSIEHSLDGVSGTTLNFPQIPTDGTQNVDIEIMTIPVFFGI